MKQLKKRKGQTFESTVDNFGRTVEIGDLVLRVAGGYGSGFNFEWNIYTGVTNGGSPCLSYIQDSNSFEIPTREIVEKAKNHNTYDQAYPNTTFIYFKPI